MKSFAIYGSSDDIVVQEENGKPTNEFGEPRSFQFVAGIKTLHATLSFKGKKGTGWRLLLELADEEETGDLPFEVTVVQELYSPKLIVQKATVPVTVMSRGKTIGAITATAAPDDDDVCAECAVGVACMNHP